MHHRPTAWDIYSHRNSYSLAWHAVKDVVQGLAQSSNLQVSSKYNRSGRLINFSLKIIIGIGVRSQEVETNMRLLCYKWVRICLRALPFQFPWHETLYGTNLLIPLLQLFRVIIKMYHSLNLGTNRKYSGGDGSSHYQLTKANLPQKFLCFNII